jgi:diguanylate cyclase (GGDEF)-like protein/PAS domain S-box-containing protein
MKCPSIPETEAERLKALSEYGLGSDRPLPSLDAVVRIAARMFDMPVAAVNMIGSDHVFFAASVGVGDVDMGRDVSFCAHAITQDGVMVVPDAMADERFHDNPLVTGSANLRFYAGVPVCSPDGHALGALCIIDSVPHGDFTQEDRDRLRELAQMASDRLELRRIEVSAEQAKPSFEEFARDAATPVIWFDADGQLVTWNEAAAVLLGYDLGEAAGLSVDGLLVERERAAFRALILRGVAAGSLAGLDIPAEIGGLRKDGTEFRLGCSLFSWQEQGHPRFSAVLRDMSDRQREEEELQRHANFDILTGLANRGRFYRHVEEALAQSLPVTVVMIDLDGFKDVNDTLGHAVGDGILCEVARRLESCVGPDDTVARIGGDEFAIMLSRVDDLARAIEFARKVNADIARSIVIDAQEVRVAASCGVALSPLHAQEPMELVGNADLALFKAKTSGRGRSFVFVPALRMEATARRRHGMELHRAVDDGEFLLFYQPQVRLADGSLTGAEALLRWLHPERGLQSPAAFLPALEGGPLAATVGSWVLDEACAQAALWRRNGADTFRIGVNLFGAQFRVGDLASEVIETLERHGLPPEALELEITENIALDHDDFALNSLRRLRQYGVGISFDDFGTGYASLSLLKRYPLSRIKIDQSFVRGMLTSKQDASVIRAVLDMARSFDLETIAEGIETDMQHGDLLRQHCDEGQGYLFGKPMPARQFAKTFGITPSLQVLRAWGLA